jgi:hypothetical protein
MTLTPADMIEKYLQLRNKVNKIEAKHKEELAPYTKVREQLENLLLAHLNDTGTDSAKCKAGTAFKSTATSVTVKDWTATLTYIKDNNLWDLLEARVSKTATVEIIEETKKPVPGVQISRATVLRVRAT